MLTYAGQGYTRAFTRNFDRVIARLHKGAVLQLVIGPDDVCSGLSGSPMRRHCRSRDVMKRDRDAFLYLKRRRLLVDASPLSRSALRRLRQAFEQGVVRRACAGCSWKALCDSKADDNFTGCRL
jgi:uncharacterized protein